MADDSLGLKVAVLLIGIGVGAGIAYALFKNKESTVPLRAKELPVRATNAEEWKWKDWQGKTRTITIHREVKG